MLEEVAGEEVRLLAALGAADLDDHVLAVVRVLRAGAAARSSASSRSMSASAPVDLGPHLLAVVAVELAEHLLGRLEVAGARPQLLRRLHDRPELAVAPGDLLVPALIGDQRQGRRGALRDPGAPARGLEADPTSSEATADAARLACDPCPTSSLRHRSIRDGRSRDGTRSGAPVAVEGDELGGVQRGGRRGPR